MSALEDYRQEGARSGVYGRIRPLDIIRKADAAIAELEERILQLKDEVGGEWAWAEQAMERTAELERLHNESIERETKVRCELDTLHEAFYQKNLEYVTVIGCISEWTKLLPRELKTAILEGKRLAVGAGETS